MLWHRQDTTQVLDARIGELTDAEYRAHAALVQYVGRDHDTDGVYHESELRHVIYSTPRGPRAVTPAQHRTFVELGLAVPMHEYTPEQLAELDLEPPKRDGFHRIHKWERFQGNRDKTAAERQARKRERDKQQEQAETTTHVTRDVTDASRVSHADRHDARARATNERTNERDDDDGVTLEREARAAGWNAKQQRAGREDPPRALAWLRASSSADRPAAFAWSGFAGGGWPDGTAARTVDVAAAACTWLDSSAWDESFDELAIAEELERIARRPNVAGELDMVGALAYWRELRADRYPEEGAA